MDWPGWIMAGIMVLGALTGLYLWFTSQLSAERNARLDQLDEEQEARLKLEREFAQYKLYVAQNLVTSGAMKETEERLIAAFDKLVSKIDTFSSRLEELTIRIASASRS